MFNKIILIGRLGQNAETRTAQNNLDYTVLNVATQESWKNDKGDYETRTEWHRVYAWGKLSIYVGTLQKGQHINLEGILRYREADSEQRGKQRFAEIHASSIKRLPRLEAQDVPRMEQTTSKPTAMEGASAPSNCYREFLCSPPLLVSRPHGNY